MTSPSRSLFASIATGLALLAPGVAASADTSMSCYDTAGAEVAADSAEVEYCIATSSTSITRAEYEAEQVAEVVAAVPVPAPVPVPVPATAPVAAAPVAPAPAPAAPAPVVASAVEVDLGVAPVWMLARR